MQQRHFAGKIKWIALYIKTFDNEKKNWIMQQPWSYKGSEILYNQRKHFWCHYFVVLLPASRINTSAFSNEHNNTL